MPDRSGICARGLRLLVRPANRKRILPTYIYRTHSSKTRTGFEVPNVGPPYFALSSFRFPFCSCRYEVLQCAKRNLQPVWFTTTFLRLHGQSPARLPGQCLQFVRFRCFLFPSVDTAAIQARVKPHGQLSAEATCVRLNVDSTDVLCHQGFLCVWTSFCC